MTAWNAEDLATIGNATEFEISSLRPDGSLRPFVTIWGVRHGDDLYVRSVNGRTAAWFRGAQARHEGRIWAGGVEKDVRSEEAGELSDELDVAYRTKYRRYPSSNFTGNTL